MTSGDKERFVLDDMCEKLLRLALDPGAGEGEARNAWMLLLKRAKASKVEAQAVIESLRTMPSVVTKVVKVPVPDPNKPFPWEGVRMPFGKYRGWSIGQIARHFPDYLYWSVENLQGLNPAIKDSMHAALDWIEGA